MMFKRSTIIAGVAFFAAMSTMAPASESINYHNGLIAVYNSPPGKHGWKRARMTPAVTD